MIEKPITLVREDFVDALAALINNSKLPAFIIEPVLRDVHNEVHTLAQKQLEADRERYINALESEEEES